jgi:hypothetical protein
VMIANGHCEVVGLATLQAKILLAIAQSMDPEPAVEGSEPCRYLPLPAP